MVWNSLRIKLPKISALMILSNHIVEFENLKYRNNDECLLYKRKKFISLAALGDDDDMDGNYFVYDMKKRLYLRRGMSELGMKRRWENMSVLARDQVMYTRIISFMHHIQVPAVIRQLGQVKM